jgi:hypothetical protein
MSTRIRNNKYFITGVLLFDIGIAVVIIGAIISNPLTLGIASGLLIMGMGSMIYGIVQENN